MDKLLPPSPLTLSRNAGEGVLDERHFDRVRWRCRRGMLELDVILKEFLDAQYSSLTPAEQQAFDRLLGSSDNTLLAYVQGSENPPDQELIQLVSKLRK
jgi:antitoxin CptB